MIDDANFGPVFRILVLLTVFLDLVKDSSELFSLVTAGLENDQYSIPFVIRDLLAITQPVLGTPEDAEDEWKVILNLIKRFG